MSAADELAWEALEACGPMLNREQFGVFVWCEPCLETAAWNVYRAATQYRQ
jgi:hypothetical protein